MPDYEAIHSKNISSYSNKVKQLYFDVINDILKLSAPLKLNANGEFYWRNYPEINDKVNKLILAFNSNVYATTVEGVNLDWGTAVEANNAVAQNIYGAKLADLPKTIRENYLSNNGEARCAFIQRKLNGLKLSDRVWKNSRQLKTDLELALEIGIGDGKSAAKLSQDVRQYLNDPEKLFRRVRSKEDGALRLSKAYKTYAPGQGVYKSSYKNALRLTRNEINFAYETSNKEKRKQQDFVVGIEIKVSPGHNPADDKGGISCVSLQGKYSKDFDFTRKWHVSCLCQSFNILKTESELDEDLSNMLDGKNPLPSDKSKNAVSKLPTSFIGYAKNNKDKFKNWKTKPYWLDNIK